MKLKTGDLDRRIMIEVGVEVPDENNDLVLTWPSDPSPAGETFKRWAKMQTGRSVEINSPENQMVLREADVVFTVRFDSKTAILAPETSRVIYKPRGGVSQVYQIIGVLMTGDRHDGVKIATSFRPDERGSAGPIDGDS